MGYLKETVTIDVYGTATPVGTVGDYLFIEKPKTTKLLYKRLNRNRPYNSSLTLVHMYEQFITFNRKRSSNSKLSLSECTEIAEKLQNNFRLQYLEEIILYYEANPLKFKINRFVISKEFITMRFLDESRALRESRSELETLYYCIYEGSNRALKYTYRVGFDVDTGKQVAVQFITEPNKIIIAVGDKEYRHIDHKTDALEVNAIITRDHQSLKRVRIVGMFNKKVLKTIRAFDNLLQKSGKAPELMSYCDLVKTPEFLKKLKECIKTANVETEEYIVGKECGADKYKTTKLFWDSSESKFFAFYHRDF